MILYLEKGPHLNHPIDNEIDYAYSSLFKIKNLDPVLKKCLKIVHFRQKKPPLWRNSITSMLRLNSNFGG